MLSLRITTEIGKVTFTVVWALQMHSLLQYGITSSNKSTDKHVIMNCLFILQDEHDNSKVWINTFLKYASSWRGNHFANKKKSWRRSNMLTVTYQVHNSSPQHSYSFRICLIFTQQLVVSLKKKKRRRRRRKVKYVKPQNFNSAFCSPPQCAISCFCCISVLAVCRLESK